MKLRAKLQSHQVASKAEAEKATNLEQQISDINDKVSDQAKAIEGRFGYVRAQAYVLPYNVAVCIKSIPASVQAKASASYTWATTHRTQVAYGLGFCALAFGGCVSVYKNRAVIQEVGSDVMSKALKSCTKNASYALKVVAEKAATASAKLAK